MTVGISMSSPTMTFGGIEMKLRYTSSLAILLLFVGLVSTGTANGCA